ncbi:Uncharacterized protein APZ42_015368 [Daphnia magna]|uniref:Uncharacterized protein n=1 Tax=Daphnia magna TaxID=35525 RepID=A0A162PDL8_9CRUS|nr:Uncharacterized protein APZ42_015368 [Daphnia magna]
MKRYRLFRMLRQKCRNERDPRSPGRKTKDRRTGTEKKLWTLIVKDSLAVCGCSAFRRQENSIRCLSF